MLAAIILLIVGFVAGYWVGTGAVPNPAEFGLGDVPGVDQYEQLTERVLPNQNRP